MNARYVIKPALAILAAIAAVSLCVAAVSRLDMRNSGQAKNRALESLRQGIVSYYASNGTYPENIDDVISQYGIQIDTSRYTVFYMPLGENLMPDIDITERSAAR